MPIIHVKSTSIFRSDRVDEFDVYVPRCGTLCWRCSGKGFGYPSGWHEYQELDSCEECGGRTWLYNKPPQKLNGVKISIKENNDEALS